MKTLALLALILHLTVTHCSAQETSSDQSSSGTVTNITDSSTGTTSDIDVDACNKLVIRSKCEDLVCDSLMTDFPGVAYLPGNDGLAAIGVAPSNNLLMLAFEVNQLSGIPTTGQTVAQLHVDSMNAKGQAVQASILYDWTGDNRWDRTEIFPFFATDPVVGFEEYTADNATVIGSPYKPFENGSLKLEIWQALPTSESMQLRTDSSVSGQISNIMLPYKDLSTASSSTECATEGTTRVLTTDVTQAVVATAGIAQIPLSLTFIYISYCVVHM